MVLILFVIDAKEETIAAINAAKVSPNKPFGKSSSIILGYAISESSIGIFGNKYAAHIPGKTITKGIS